MFTKSLILILTMIFATTAHAGPLCRKAQHMFSASCDISQNLDQCYETCPWYLEKMRKDILHLQIKLYLLPQLKFTSELARNLGRSLMKNDSQEDQQQGKDYLEHADWLDKVQIPVLTYVVNRH